MDNIRYSNGYFYDDPRDYRELREDSRYACHPGESHLPDYMHIDTAEHTPQLFGVLTFCGERGPAGAAVLGAVHNDDIILAGDGTRLSTLAYTAAALEG